MGDHPTSSKMPGTINSTSTVTSLPLPLGNQYLNQNQENSNAAYYSHSNLKPRHVARNQTTPNDHFNTARPGSFEPLTPFSMNPLTPPNSMSNKGNSWDTARIILLQKQAIDTVEKCPTLTKYVTAAVGYTEKFKSFLNQGEDEKAYVSYHQAHHITSKVIPEHVSYREKIIQKPGTPIALLYQELLNFFKNTEEKNQIEELEDRMLHGEPLSDGYITSDEEHIPPFEVEPFPTQPDFPAPPKLVEPLSNLRDSFPPSLKSGEIPNQTFDLHRTPFYGSSPSLNHYPSHDKSPQLQAAHIHSSQLHFPSPPKHTVSLPRSASNLDLAKQAAPELRLPLTNVINSETLDKYMSQFSENILFLDVRHRSSFNAGRFPSANVVCIDPTILKDQMSEIDLESSLRGSPSEEQHLFHSRNKFELVVYYSDNTSKLESQGQKTVSQVAMGRLVECIYSRSFIRPLKRSPCLLIGGLDAWIECMGPGSVWRQTPQSSPELCQNMNRLMISPQVIPRQNLPSVNDRSRAPNGSPLYSRDVADYFKSPNFGTSPEYQLSNVMSRPSYNSTSPNNLSHIGGINSVSTISTQPSPTMAAYSRPHYVQDQNRNPLGVQPYSPAPIKFSEFATGLVNLGNTCYMNCILQCLIGTTQLGEMFLKGEYQVFVDSKLGYKGQLANTFSRLVRTMYQTGVNSGRGRVSYFAPKEIKYVCGQLSESFRGSEQQDCHEFLNFILDGLHEDLNRRGNKPPLKPLTEREEGRREAMNVREASVREWIRHLANNESPISNHVQGQYLSRLECRVCGCKSTTYNAFSCLSIPIRLGYQEVTLEDCFKLFTQPELLEGDDAWNCPNCKKRQPTIKTIRISRVPDFLIIHLKRFKHQGGVWGSNKLGTYVSYPGVGQELDLQPFLQQEPATGVTGAVSPQVNSQSQFQAQPATPPQMYQIPPYKYKLYGVANHYGSLKGGHYTAYVRREGPYGWCLFDDARVRINVGRDEVVNKNAYVLFYERTGRR